MLIKDSEVSQHGKNEALTKRKPADRQLIAAFQTRVMPFCKCNASENKCANDTTKCSEYHQERAAVGGVSRDDGVGREVRVLPRHCLVCHGYYLE